MSNLIVPNSDLIEVSKGFLAPQETQMLETYLKNGGLPLSPESANRFFQLFLSGEDCKEIHRLNKAFPYEAILMARIKYKWDEKRDQYINDLAITAKEKVLKAQLETTSLMADMLSAANKKHGDKIKRYLQTGDEEDLKGALNIESLHNLMKISENLMKITGQDRQFKVTNENKNTLDVNVKATGNSSADLNAEEAAIILKTIADAKRRKNNEFK